MEQKETKAKKRMVCVCPCAMNGHVGRCRGIAEGDLYFVLNQGRRRPAAYCKPCYRAVFDPLPTEG